MGRYKPSLVLSVFISFLSFPIIASSNDASDLFNAFKRGVGKAFTDIKDVATSNAEKRENNQVEEPVATTNNSATVRNSSASSLSIEENKEIQNLLTNAGYNPGPADGFPGNKTKAAIRKYQAANGIPIDGEPSRNLLDQLKDNITSSTPTSSKTSSTTSKNSYKTSAFEPFGIPLNGRYSSTVFVSATKGNIYQGLQTYKVIPKKSHPAFDYYAVSVNSNNVIASITATGRKDGGDAESCYDAGLKIAHAIGSKYGVEIRRQEKNKTIEIYHKTKSINGRKRASLHYRWSCLYRGNKKRRIANFTLKDPQLTYKAMEQAKKNARTPKKELGKDVKDVF